MRGEGTNDGTFQDVNYFKCDPNCAVFVSMDKLFQKCTVEAAKLALVKSQLPQPQDDKPFEVGDKVKVYDKHGFPIKGIVKTIKKGVLGIEAVSYMHAGVYVENIYVHRTRLEYHKYINLKCSINM